MSEGGALKKKTDEGASRMDAIHTAYERGQADKIFTDFLDKLASPTGGGFRVTPKVASNIFDNWHKLLGEVDDLLKDKVYQKEFLAHLKKSIEGTTKGDFPDNAAILAIVNKLGETMRYHNLPVMFRQEDHAEVREAMVNAIKYNLAHPASPQWMSYNIGHTDAILEKFGVRSEKSEPVQKTVRKGILRRAHTEMVMEEHELSSAKRLEIFKEGKF